MRAKMNVLTLLVLAVLAGCDAGTELETRTFQVAYLQPHAVQDLLTPYVYTDRAENPGVMSTSDAAVTVRETPDNLEQIARVLEQYDRPRPTVMLHFQIIRADGATDTDPAIADIERELRRLFRFDGYELVAEATVGGIAGTLINQQVGQGEDEFFLGTGVTDVRHAGDPATVTLDVRLGTPQGPLLETGVTVVEGQSVVLGTAQTPDQQGALILVVRADVVEPAGAAVPTGSTTGSSDDDAA